MLKVGFSGVDFAVKAIDPVEDKLTDVSLLVFDSNGDAEMCMYAVDGAEGFEVPLVVGRRYSFRACANFGYQVYSDNLKELDELRCYLAYPDEYSVIDFCEEHPTGTYLLALREHVVCVRDGQYYDSWDSGEESPVYYWQKKEN